MNYKLWLGELFFSNDYYENAGNMNDHIISAG